MGNFHFRCLDVAAFRARLAALGFRARDRPDGAWDAREPVARFSLHVKHFAGWPDDRLQAHIDPWGVGGPWTALMHLLDYHGYRDEERIARALRASAVHRRGDDRAGDDG
ncbi:MAG: hypothetical protein AAGD14_02390 [Planctomycetota bacterium]